MSPDPLPALFASVVEVVAQLYPGSVPRVVKIKLHGGQTIHLPIPMMEALAAAAAATGRTTTER